MWPILRQFPRVRTMTLIDRLRAICMALPEAEERETWEIPTFRIRAKIFAMAHPVGDRASVWCKAPLGVQTILTEAAPDRFFRPPYVGQMEALIRRSYGMTAPKKLLKGQQFSR
jgi:hypothetical protein